MKIIDIDQCFLELKYSVPIVALLDVLCAQPGRIGPEPDNWADFDILRISR